MIRLVPPAFLLLALAASPASAEDTAKLLADAGVTGGLVVHLGCGDGTLTAALRTGDGIVVHGLDADAVDVAKARAHIAGKGLTGAVTVGTFDGRNLPFTDGLAKLLVVSEPGQVARAEMMRVLAPLGVLCVREGGAWKRTVKPWPKEIDAWTHYLRGPDNNAVARDTVVGPPRHLQWVGEPRWTRNHHKLNSISSVVTAQGRLFFIVDEATASNMAVPGKWWLVGRDAFSGVVLWKKPMKSWTWHLNRFRSGPPQVTRLLVVSGDRLYAPLGLSEPVSEMDAVTGRTLRTFEGTGGAEELILVDDTLLVLKGEPVAAHAVGHVDFKDRLQGPNRKSVVAIQAETGKVLWTCADPGADVRPETLASDGKRVYFQVGEGVACLDLKSGKKLWTSGATPPKAGGAKPKAAKGRKKRAGSAFGKSVLVVSDGVVLCNLSNQLKALSAADGKELWSCPGGTGFHAPMDVFVIDGLVWRGIHPRDSVAPPPVTDFNEGRDLHTGEVKRRNQIMVDLQTAGHHHRCYREKATVRYIMTGKRGVEMMDLAGDNHSRNNWVRGTCQYGFLPANGLIYAPSHSCGCYMASKLFGFYALAAERPVTSDAKRRVPDAGRLEKGPAYGKAAAGAAAGADMWPQYRHDPLRSGIAGTTVPAKPVPAWQAEIGGRLTPPVIAGGKVLVAAVDANAVHALDAATGKALWTHVAGGRVDSPPAIHGGLVLFGSADGRVTCLRLDDGTLVWRFFAAPADLRVVAYDQVESVWPVHGSVLVLNGVAYCSAGRSTWLDGGIDLYGLDPATGKVVCKAHYESRHPKLNEGKEGAKPEHVTKVSQNTTDYRTFLQPDRSDSFSMAGGSISDVLVSDGRNVFMHQAAFTAKLERRDRMARHLYSTTNFLDDTENHRSHWILGTGDHSRVPVAYPWVVNRAGRGGVLAVPTGVMMVYDAETVWGVQRKGDANGQYQLFGRKNVPFSDEKEPLSDMRKAGKDAALPYLWRVPLTVRARAMLKAGDHLVLAAMPVAIPADDPHAAYEGRKGGMLWIASTKDGGKVAEIPLDAPPVWDGLAAAGGRLYVSTADGKVRCLGKK
jgi:outer membrane protein assembly factor BamB